MMALSESRFGPAVEACGPDLHDLHGTAIYPRVMRRPEPNAIGIDGDAIPVPPPLGRMAAALKRWLWM
jgi:hypothetical protein